MNWGAIGGLEGGEKMKATTKYPGVRYREHPTRRKGGKPDRYFFIRYYDAQGKRHEEGLGWSSEGWTAEQASRVLGDIRSNIRLGTGPASLADKRQLQEQARREQTIQEDLERIADITVAETAERFLAWAKVNKRSWRADESRIRIHIIPAFGRFPLRSLGSARIENLKTALMERGLSTATVRHILGLVRRLFNFAGKTAYSEEMDTPMFAGRSPCGAVQIPRQDNNRLRFFSREDADRVLEQAKEFPKRRRRGRLDFHDICLLSLMTGMRKGEIQSLEWADVDMAHGVIRIRDAKAGDGIAHMNSDVLDMMQRRGAEAGPGLVFKGAIRGGRVRNISHTFADLAGDLGLNDGVSDPRQEVCFHTLRHTFASWLALQGTDIYRIKELMRHKTITQTMRYAHLIPGATKDAVEGLARRGKESPLPKT